MSTAEKIIEEVLPRLIPTEEERRQLADAFEKIKRAIEQRMSSAGVSGEVTLQGSVAHDTWLRGSKDIDVFVLFSGIGDERELKEKGFRIIREAVEGLGEIKLRYAEHPYVRLRMGEVEADIVPAFKLSRPEEVRTAVDRTPFHTQYVVARLGGRLNNDVRLLKKFMKSIGVYGAEVKTKGFSGYAAELLIIASGGFLNALRMASGWSLPAFVNTLGDERLFRDAVARLVKKYPDSVLYMPDPVDPDRNVAASVSLEKMAKFVIASRCFLSSPSKRFFEEPKAPSLGEVLERLSGRCVVVVEVESREELPPDVIWGEADRVRDRCVKALANHDFSVVDSVVWTDEARRAVILVELDECARPAYKAYEGPPFTDDSRVRDFISKHRWRTVKLWIGRDGHIRSLSKRKFELAIDYLRDRVAEYLVAPHFRGVRPRVALLDTGEAQRLASVFGVEPLAALAGGSDEWLFECTA